MPGAGLGFRPYCVAKGRIMGFLPGAFSACILSRFRARTLLSRRGERIRYYLRLLPDEGPER